MKLVRCLFLLMLTSVICVKSSQIFTKLFGQVLVPQQTRYYNAHSYQYPASPYQQYPQNANGYYYQPLPLLRQQRHRNSPIKQEKSYKDICHMVHNDGFTNPGNVPKCPF